MSVLTRELLRFNSGGQAHQIHDRADPNGNAAVGRLLVAQQ